ncbi:hypothetical protein HMPREF1140_2485 [Lachnoanaerobaculum sp. ICM7]|uniref:hypothetical protein n=1 Tax=Lachnoanaerobaculum sp. ICM7 TaxID=936594 RepID=UPI00027A5E78|nr:hypothetical protein [Lachnoanaerobaculum sp. ICM7]EJP18709.1 hypothetical protein HMPREF1140_2485 [Lachnoanaerobaculum sp. ICM7]
MSMNDMLRKMAVLLERRQDALFSYDVDKQRKYIEKLGNPRDEIERSYFQYKCQMQFNGKGITFLLNLISFPVAIIYWFKYGKKGQVNQMEPKSLVFFRDGKPENILPKSLKNKYDTIESNPVEGTLLTEKDKKFIKKIIYRYPFSWQFILKCLIKIGRYSFAIEEYSPKAIAVCAEYSFTSSVLTAYCKQRNIKHIDVMHGEKMYYMRDSFFKFDECYIWDEYYGKVLTSMKADRNQFVVEVPASLKFDEELPRIQKYDYTYYLGAESEDVLKKIAKILEKLYKNGKRISIRPHPRYSNMELVKKIFAFANVEDTKKISIEQSLLQSGAAISLYSTVLNQALYNSIPIVIDNMSNPENFAKLKELGYVCLYKEYELLSNVMRKQI